MQRESGDGDLTVRLGRLLRIERELARLSQAALARRAGMRQQNVSRFEAGGLAPTTTVVQRLFAALGLQLRLEVEPLDADLDEAIARAAGQGTEDLEGVLDGWRALQRPAGDLRHRVGGALAARLYGVAVPVRPAYTVLVAEADLDGLAGWILAVPNCRRYSEKWRDFSGFDVDPRRPGPLRWWTPFGELTVRLLAELPAPVMVRVGGRELPLCPLPEIERGDPDVARVLRRLRPASGLPPA
jgi:transcriptional regulator with XRE-family HTH domain